MTEHPVVVETLDDIAGRLRTRFAAQSAARDAALVRSRELIRHCSQAIRAVHRQEFEVAGESLAMAWALVQELEGDLAQYPELYDAGYVQDALKEYAEAQAVDALVQRRPIPSPEELHVPSAPYLNGLAEAIGELRRHILDCLRRGTPEPCESLLASMDEIFAVLVSMDFPDALTGNLRRSTDVARGIMEKTRGDLTLAMQQRELERSLEAFEGRMRALSDRKGNNPGSPE